MLAVFGYADYAVFDQLESRAVMAFAAIACSFDMWTSVAYHLFNTMRVREGETLLKYDFTGIVAVMLAFFVGLAYKLFYRFSWERKIILAVITPTIIANFIVLFHPHFRKDAMH